MKMLLHKPCTHDVAVARRKHNAFATVSAEADLPELLRPVHALFPEHSVRRPALSAKLDSAWIQEGFICLRSGTFFVVRGKAQIIRAFYHGIRW